MPVVRAQILLDRARFSPGEIDGHYGGDIGVAVKGYQEAHNLTPSGIIGPQMKLLNEDERPLIQSYTIVAADARGPFMTMPKDVEEQARLNLMGYESPAEKLAETFHVSRRLLAELNPGIRVPGSPGSTKRNVYIKGSIGAPAPTLKTPILICEPSHWHSC